MQNQGKECVQQMKMSVRQLSQRTD